MAETNIDQKEKDTINFNELLKEYRDRTECYLPHTMTRVEDVMFINDNHLVALEYVFYNNDGKYYHLETTDKGNSELGV